MIPIRKGYAALNHGHVHYREAGNGPCIVFLHQAAGDSRTFEPIIDLLADSYRCVAIDLPGFGMSDYAPQALSVPGYAAIVVETLDSLGVEYASIFGQHGGSAVAAEIAAAHAARVDRLILSGAPLYTKEQGEANLAGFPRLVLKEDGSHLIDFWTYMATWTPPKNDAEARAMTYELVGRLRPGPRNVEAYAAAFTYDLEGGLRRIAAPTLVLAGENAPGVKDVDPVCSFLAKAKGAIVPNVGNWLEVEPRVLVDILKDFLKAEG